VSGGKVFRIIYNYALLSIPIKISQPTCVDPRSRNGKLHGGQVNAATNSRYHREVLSASFIMRCQTIDNKDEELDEAPGLKIII